METKSLESEVITRIEAHLTRLEEAVASLKNDVGSLKTDVASLKNNVASLPERVARLEGITDTIKWSIWLGFTLLALLISILRIV